MAVLTERLNLKGQSKTLRGADFGLVPNTKRSMSSAAALALIAAQQCDKSTLALDPGTYNFFPDDAQSHLCWISNNNAGQKQVAFPIVNCESLTIDGLGAEFIFHGAISPFVVDNSSNISLRNLRIDWSDPVTLFGQILNVDHHRVRIAIDPKCRYRIENGRILTGPIHWEASIGGFIELEPISKTPAYRTGDVWNDGNWDVSFAELEPHVVTFDCPPHRTVTPGNHIVFLRGDRNNPGIFVTESSNIAVENVTVYQSPAMAFIAQRTENISLDRFNVMLRERTGQIVSASADATHCVGCRGQITIKNCLFEGQLDDPGNVHGTYVKLLTVIDARTVIVGRMHPEQLGVPYAGPGDKLSGIEPSTMEHVISVTVSAVEEINPKQLKIVFAEPLQDINIAGLVFENDSWVPDLHIDNCIARRNRARGFLISTPGQVVIENCTLHPGGTGILIPGESEYWFESGAVRDVTLRNNMFINCETSAWGRAAIDITPMIPNIAGRKSPFHCNITIEGNQFNTFDIAILAAWSVDGVKFCNNSVTRNNDYIPFGAQKDVLSFVQCENVVVEGNTFCALSRDGVVRLDSQSALGSKVDLAGGLVLTVQ